MPSLKLSDEEKLTLYTDIQNKTTLPIEFVNRQCDSIQLNSGQKQFDWRLSTAAEKPRFVLLGFQRNKLNSSTSNSAVFDHLNVEDIRVEFNGEYYPDKNMNLDFKANRYIQGYHMLTDYFKNVMMKQCCYVRVGDFKTHYTVFVFDISRQKERMKNTMSDIRIRGTFNANIPQNVHAYALILSDKELQMQSDGNRMHVLD